MLMVVMMMEAIGVQLGSDRARDRVNGMQVEDRFHRYCRPEKISPPVLQRYVDGKYGDVGLAQVRSSVHRCLSLSLSALQCARHWGHARLT
jgi:hypothetical protein